MSVDVAAENAETTGRDTFSNLNITGHGDINVAGFARSISVNIGETVEFCVDGGATAIDIYRVGWYGGDGFRLIDTVTNTPTSQPEADEVSGSNGGTTCTAWAVTAEWAVPGTATSGLYLALVRSVAPQAPNAFYISFVVRDDAAEADIVYKTSDSTWGAAYNHYGTKADIDGSNVYGTGVGVGTIQFRSHMVSYHRPVITRGGVSQTFWMACEMPLIRWLERNGFTIKYISCVDLDQEGSSLLVDKAQVFVSSGHDEYWTQNMWDAIVDWRDNHAGRSIFMSGNEVFWRARYVYDGDEAQMWCYKDTMPGPGGHSSGIPLDPVTWTGTWKDTRWVGNTGGEWMLTGTDFRMNGVNDYDATIVSNPYGGHKVWGGTSLNDADITLTRVIGFEADSARPTQPDESVRMLAAYTRSINGAYADDNGETYNGDGDLEWGIVSQRYTGGGLTVGFGTCQWSWALDSTHDRTATEVSEDAQQFTMNLLRDLGAEPETPQSGLTLEPLGTLDDYGLEPGSVGPTPWRLGDGTPMRAYAVIDGTLVPVTTS